MPSTAFIAIRRFTESDIPHCAAIMAAAPLFQRYNTTLESAAKRLTEALSENAVLFVAEEETGHPLGFVWIVLNGAFARSGYIRVIGVAPDQQSKGIGARLLEAAEKFVAQHSRDLLLLCSDFNTEAQRFYERHGYERIGELSDYALDGVAEVIYRKRLY